LKHFAHLPKPGERLTIDGLDFEVERLDRQMIASVLVTTPPSESDEERQD
jgi:Mg2+/Co2+ transporter CorC